MGNFSFENDVYVLKCNAFNTAVAGGARLPASTAFIDMKGIEHGVFLVGIGTENDASTFQVYQDTSATETGSIKVVTGASQLVAADDDNKWFSIEFDAEDIDRANSYRYVTLSSSVGGAGDDYYCVFFLGFQTRSSPVTQAAGYAYHVAV
jgi:hypothetical protein